MRPGAYAPQVRKASYKAPDTTGGLSYCLKKEALGNFLPKTTICINDRMGEGWYHECETSARKHTQNQACAKANQIYEHVR